MNAVLRITVCRRINLSINILYLEENGCDVLFSFDMWLLLLAGLATARYNRLQYMSGVSKPTPDVSGRPLEDLSDYNHRLKLDTD